MEHVEMDRNDDASSTDLNFLEDTISRRTFLQRTAVLAGLGMTGGLGLPSSACGGSSPASTSSSASSSPKIGGQLSLIGWQGYEGYPAGIKPWLKQNGISIKESPITGNDQILSLLRSGGAGLHRPVHTERLPGT